jgi:cell division septation protein DedD
MFPAATAGGDYAVSWGSFATVASADASVASLRASQLPAYREAATVDGKSVQRVRIGPYASRADAEAARLRAAHVRDDMDAKVITLDVATAAPKPAATAPRPAAADTGFAVQVAAFSSQADADELVARARAAGFSAFTETVSIGASKLVRVRVGPVSTRAEADRLQAQVKAKLGIDGLVRPHP